MVYKKEGRSCPSILIISLAKIIILCEFAKSLCKIRTKSCLNAVWQEAVSRMQHFNPKF